MPIANQEIELEVESIGFEGVAIARHEGMVYMLEGGLPGDIIKTKWLKKKRNYYQGKVGEILKESSLRVKPECSHFGECGGCSWQDLNYTSQLEWKRKHVTDSFTRIGKLDIPEVKPTMPSPKVFHYRNKMEFSFSSSRWLTEKEVLSNDESIDKGFALGLHVRGRFDKVLDVEKCFIQAEIGNTVLNIVKSNAKRLNIAAYNSRENIGFLRNLIIRTTDAHSDLMIVLVTNIMTELEQTQFIASIENEFEATLPANYNFIHALNSTRSPVKIEESIQIHGKNFITENILGVEFKISPYSFFQTNPSQLNKFIYEIINTADLTGKTVWDLYCGTGSITLPAANKCKKIIGIELSDGSIANAKENMKLNKIKNAEFYCSDLHAKNIPDLLSKLEKPDLIIFDPPRAGLHQNLLAHIMELDVKELVYVSCNPATQARDCEILSEKYNITSVQPVDMFPHTYHIESIAKLELKAK